MSILVTGGAGYIGSHTVAELLDHGEDVVVVDHLQQGHIGAIRALGVPFYPLDIRDTEPLTQVLRLHRVDTVVHFAANSLVGESVQNPLKYYENNVAATGKLLSAMMTADVKRIVFSSTAAVYGEPRHTPIEESLATVPTNPYGESKLAIERMLRWCYQAYDLQSISLRYFNAAGAHPGGHIGEDHNPESHLIPIVLQVALGMRETVSIFGSDYQTPDGTCIRDYIHVMDLASAHRLSVDRLRTADVSTEAYNLGSGQGFSVEEVVQVAREVTGHPIPVVKSPRREGDPAVLVASSRQAMDVLGWKPQHEQLKNIIASAYAWHQSHPGGFDDKSPISDIYMKVE